jgi:hypothetical protein
VAGGAQGRGRDRSPSNESGQAASSQEDKRNVQHDCCF